MKNIQEEEKATCMEAMDFMKDWNTYRATLRESISKARRTGLPEGRIQQIATQFTDYVAEKVCPATPEEALLKEIWNTANPPERKVLMSVLFKMFEKEP